VGTLGDLLQRGEPAPFDDVQQATFHLRRAAQRVLLRRGDRDVAVGVAVGVAQRDGAQQALLLGGRGSAPSGSDDGEQGGPVAVRQDRDERPDAQVVQGEPQVVQGGAAGDPQLPVVGVGDRHGAFRVGVQLDRVRGRPEPPRLAVVQ
jgi:hypothetical protein